MTSNRATSTPGLAVARHRTTRGRCGALLATVLFAFAPAVGAQSLESPSPTPLPVPASAATPLPAPLPAGVIPATVALTVTGSSVDGTFVAGQIRAALDREIRPTLHPGASIVYGAIAPWPLLPLAESSRITVNVTVAIAGANDNSAPVTAVSTVTVDNAALAPTSPDVLFLSDDPEYLLSEGVAFRGNIALNRSARLYYYHDDIGVPRDLDIVLTATTPSRVQIIGSQAGPDLDVMSVGHTVSRDFLLMQQRNEGTLVDVAPGRPYIVRHDLLLQGELVAGALDVRVVTGGPATVSVVASPAGARPEAYLGGPRLAFDGHNRHGTFALDGFGAVATSYTVGGPDVAVKYGGKNPTPRNIDPNDPGRDYGDYGVIRRISTTFINATDEPHRVYFYEKPLGGPVRATFLVEGQLKEVGCVRLPQPYWLMTYQLPPHSTGATTTLTMTDGGSFYPLEFGVTETPPLPYTPPPYTADGCSPRQTAAPDPGAIAPSPKPLSSPTSLPSGD